MLKAQQQERAMDRCDVLVVGAGLAGLQTARLLGESGLQVCLIDRKPSLSYGVHTTGIFVKRTLDDFEFPANCLGPAIRSVTLYSPRGVPLDLESEHTEFRIGRMGPLYCDLLRQCRSAGVQVLLETSYAGCEAGPQQLTVQLQLRQELRPLQTRFIIAADGARSRVAADLGLSQNKRWIVGVENVHSGVPGAPRLHCFLDPQLAPGYLAWAACDGEEAHVGVGGDAQRFQPLAALKAFHERAGEVINLSASRFREHRSGRIPIGGVLPRLANERGMLVGDAAGAVSPLTAGGFDGCMRLSELAASVAERYVRSGDAGALRSYDGAQLRSRFRRRQLLRYVWDRMQSPWMVEAACGVMRQPLLQAFAERVFFGYGSFPDLIPAEARRSPRRVQVPVT